MFALRGKCQILSGTIEMNHLVQLRGSRSTYLKMSFSNPFKLFPFLFILCCYGLHAGIAIDTITSSQSVKDPETLSSKNGNITLGFFTPQNSTKRYVGIWWKSQSIVIWVANRNQPLNDSSGVVTISEDGNLVVMNGLKHVIWSTNVSITSSNTSAQLSDSAKLVLMETTTGTILWDSFQQPSDTLLPEMKLKIPSNGTGTQAKLRSWKSPSDPSVGSFSLSAVQRTTIVEGFIWNKTRSYWRSGPWNGSVFTGIQTMPSAYLNGFQVIDDDQGNKELYYRVPSTSEFVIYVLNSQGQFIRTQWDDEKKELKHSWTSEQSDCDIYALCGPFAICNSQKSPTCSCLKGFEPNNQEEWNRQNWTSGCFRRTDLQCERVKGQNASVDAKEDEFLKLQMVKIPDFSEGSTVTPDKCKSQCLGSCSCIAYSHDNGIGCMSWTENLIDMQQFSGAGLDLYIRVAYTEVEHDIPINLVIKIPSSVVSEFSPKLGLLFDWIATATNNFHLSNKLGQGGFGPVYKGELQDGQEIAVKRLSRASRQGLEEFMNEVVVISKLQHRNLVRLFGCCVEGDEKMLIYEYMPNKSLDLFLFDPSKRKLLDWMKCCNIIEGIARGLLYLHKDSRLRIIHRDLKASNVLLNKDLDPKISDFGLARIFGGNEDEINTNRIVGTYGYMSPEYAMQGLFSEKSDVFSFGVLLLEIVSGKKIISFYDDEHGLSLLGFAWIQWNEDNILSLIDPEIYDPNHHKDIVRCIHIGLLSVQELATERPTMATVISMLNSEVTFLPPPNQPAFSRWQNMNSVPSKESSVNNSPLRFSHLNKVSLMHLVSLLGSLVHHLGFSLAHIGILRGFEFLNHIRSSSPLENPSMPPSSNSPSVPSDPYPIDNQTSTFECVFDVRSFRAVEDHSKYKAWHGPEKIVEVILKLKFSRARTIPDSIAQAFFHAALSVGVSSAKPSQLSQIISHQNHTQKWKFGYHLDKDQKKHLENWKGVELKGSLA
ncbi:hypothetical protein Fmac_011280 [Flemingia macrophylla]|uniref:non-specific serine/threonine protein kinase n=1 Tax=Flemingia macrophylla TaxID=520843 RepID=A0ABD1MM02_9FABA